MRAGAVVVAPKPEKSPSLSGYPGCDEEVHRIANEVWGENTDEHAYGKGHVIQGRSPEDVLASMDVKPDFEYTPRGARLAFIHRVEVLSNAIPWPYPADTLADSAKLEGRRPRRPMSSRYDFGTRQDNADVVPPLIGS